MRVEIPEFKTKKELYKFLVENQDSLIAQKKAIFKTEDSSVGYQGNFYNRKTHKVFKATEAFDENVDQLKGKLIINTTNFFDSHKDVHLPGIWDKSIDENVFIMHLQEHMMKFDSIIADKEDLQAYVQTFTWKELGYDYPGDTQALVFDSEIKKSRNGFMFNQYKDGHVRNHSVGMRYIKLLLAVNDEDYGAEFEAWEKYIGQVANREEAEKSGYMWIIKEAMVIEGSAVPLGSNSATPTISISDKSEPGDTTQTKIEPEQSTQKKMKSYFLH